MFLVTGNAKTNMRVALVSNAPPTSGMGKPARLLLEALRRQNQARLQADEFTIDASTCSVRKNGDVVTSLRPFTKLKPLAWVRLGRTLRLEEYDLVHLTNQTLAFLIGRFQSPTVLTVWDLIELLDPQERFGRTAARFLYAGIPRADHVIAVSRYTAGTIRSAFAVPSHRLSIISPAVSPTFTAVPRVWESVGGREFLAEQNLSAAAPRVLYVGSEHPRKNVRRLLEAVAIARLQVPDLQFLKIGRAGTAAGRAEFVSTVDRLRLWPSVRRIEELPDEDLLFWYHAATVFAFPTLNEGFGFPPLEAMACGTPVVASDRTSLPEVLGDAAVIVNPESVRSIADGLLQVLTDARLRADLREKGLVRAGMFTLEKTVSETIGVYEKAWKEKQGAKKE